MRTRTIGTATVSAIGLGGMPMSIEGRPDRERSIATIHAAGGLAVWAHPFWDLDSADEVLETLARFQVLGLDGVEAFYITHTREETGCAAGAAERLGLLTTGSADFHGPDHPEFHRFRAFDLHGHAPRLGRLAR